MATVKREGDTSLRVKTPWGPATVSVMASGVAEIAGPERAVEYLKAGLQEDVHQHLRRRRVLLGRVVSNKMDKTVVVLVVRRVKHSRYRKFMNRSKKYLAHDEQNACEVGDFVSIRECRPLSRRKRWIVRSTL